MRRSGEGVRETVPTRDGRNVDPEVGRLMGEGALQRVRIPHAPPQGEATWIGRPRAEPAEAGETPTYYGIPTLKEPVWRWYIPAYFYVGGLGGACGVLGAAADLFGGPEMRPLSQRCRLAAAATSVASAALLIADLGRPARFLAMLRVFRPTSPMNMGTWILTGFGGFSTLATLPALVPVPGVVRRLGHLAWLGAGVIGLPLTGYTGVLLANTAVPLWQGARRALPILFSCSGAAAAASMLEVFPVGGAGDEAVHRFGVISKATEVAMTFALEREVSMVARVGQPLRTGFSGALWRTAQALSAASLLASLAAGRRRRLGVAAGLLGTAGALAIRFALMRAGVRSARDPRATFEQQRAGLGAREVERSRGTKRGVERQPTVSAGGLREEQVLPPH